MMPRDEAHKRAGRFIKKGAAVLRKVALHDFSFKELCETRVINLDNSERSIIHTRLHHDSVISKIQPPPHFDMDLQPDSGRRPVLRPLDFTADWEEERKRHKQRRVKEEEDFDYQYVTAMAEKESSAEEEGEEQESGVQDERTLETPVEARAPEAQVAELEQGPLTDIQKVDIVSSAINDIARSTAPLKADDPTAVTASRSGFIPQDLPKPETRTQHDVELDEEPKIHDPEAAPAAEYQRQVTEQAETRAKEIFEEAKAQGFEAGYRHGEEKATLAVRQQASAMFGKVSELIHEFQKLKFEVLNNVQANFYELAQAVSEALIRRELRMNPEAFASFVRRAIADTVKGDQFKIRVHPETHAKLANLDLPELKASLVKDDSIEPGDFRLESELTVVDGNVRKMIKELLEEADLTLFETEDKAS